MSRFSFQNPGQGGSSRSSTRAQKKSFAHLSLTDDSKRLLIRSSFNQEFVDELKSTIPYQARLWNKSERVWEVDVDYLDLVEEMVQRYYSEIKVLFEAGGEDPFEVLFLIPDTPLDICEDVYKLLIKRYHEGGTHSDPVRWRACNDAIREIRKEKK